MPETISVQVVSDGFSPEGWVVEAINVDGDGGIETATFAGQDAEGRAREYATWKYGQASLVAQAA